MHVSASLLPAPGLDEVVSLSFSGSPTQTGPVIICGQGLAGTLLAWELVKRGVPVLVMDEGALVTSSKIAAGLVTPITGKRLSVSPGTGTFLAEAQECYAASAQLLGRRHFHHLHQVRLFRNAEESCHLAQKTRLPEFAAHLGPGQQKDGPLVDPALFHGDGTGFEMTTGGWLDTRGWLADSAAWLAERGMLRTMALDPGAVVPEGEGVLLPDGTRASAIVFCEGHQARRNPWFPWVKWKCAKGEVLTVRVPELAAEQRIINWGGWLLPIDNKGTFRTGSTYEWNTLDVIPTPQGRAVLEGRLRALLRVPWEVTGHDAAVRPVIHESQARMGRHPVHPALVFFNGLGSKGVLHGPRYARLLAEHLVHGSPLPPEVDVAGNR